jgi:hypothetical protein
MYRKPMHFLFIFHGDILSSLERCCPIELFAMVKLFCMSASHRRTIRGTKYAGGTEGMKLYFYLILKLNRHMLIVIALDISVSKQKFSFFAVLGFEVSGP